MASAARFGNVLDYAGPNLTSSQLIVYAPGDAAGFSSGPDGQPTSAQIAAAPKVAKEIAAELGTTSMIALEQTSVNLNHAASGRSWSGPIYVATPQLLSAFGISSQRSTPTPTSSRCVRACPR